ncbi:hypothetical protein EBZ80_06215 [bacterium]|nr:hypothetical protein [bacterium]
MPSLWPRKYYAGLSRATQRRRAAEIRRRSAKHWRDPAAYRPFQTDKGSAGRQLKTRTSGYTAAWRARFPAARSLAEKAAATGVPERFLRASYNRGLAAWRTGHRPGATQQQWGYARVHSFLLCGKTALTTDSDLRREAIAASAGARRWFAGEGCGSAEARDGRSPNPYITNQ